MTSPNPDGHIVVAIPYDAEGFNEVWRNYTGAGGYFAANNIYSRLVVLDVFESGEIIGADEHRSRLSLAPPAAFASDARLCLITQRQARAGNPRRHREIACMSEAELPPGWPAMSIQQAHAMLGAPGSPLEIEEIGGLFPRATIEFIPSGDQSPRDAITLSTDNRVELGVGFYTVSWTYASGGEVSIRVNIEAGRTTWVRGSLLSFPQGAGEIYVVRDLAGTVIWQAPFERGDSVWVLPGIYTMDLVERVGDPVLIMAQVQTLPGSETLLEVFTAP